MSFPINRIPPSRDPIPSLKSAKGPVKLTADKVNRLANEIKKDWDSLAPEDLAERIIDLEDRAPESRVVQNLHFKFVFPIAIDMGSFINGVNKVAKEVLKTGVAGFNQLNARQQQEVMRYTGRE